MQTTLNAILAFHPSPASWTKLLTHLGKTKADDEPLSIRTVLDSNGLDDALWCLRATTGYDREIRLLAVWFARQVQHLLTDTRSIDALDVAERYANGQATDEELVTALAAAEAARTAALEAALVAEWAAEAAVARAAAWAAWAATLGAALVAAWAAGEDARAAQEARFRQMLDEIEQREAA